MEVRPKPELVCPAGSLPALKAAVDNGADCVYIGLKDETNARNFSGLNFDAGSATEGVRYANPHVLAEHQPGHALFGRISEGLHFLRCVNTAQPNLVLSEVRV